MLVDNEVLNDSRVLKSAASAARAGYSVHVIGRRSKGRELIVHRELFAIERLAIPRLHETYRMRSPGFNLRRPLAYREAGQINLRKYRLSSLEQILRRRRVAFARGRSDRPVQGLIRRDRHAQLYILAMRPLYKVRRKFHSLRLDQYKKSATFQATARRLNREGPLAGFWDAVRYWMWPRRAWRQDDPWLTDWISTVAPIVRKLEPDIIHAHDSRALAVATVAADQISLAKRARPAILADVHEWFAGVSWAPRAQRYAVMAMQDEFLPAADAVTTVSSELAELLQRRDPSIPTPEIVLNAPETRNRDLEGKTLREHLVVEDDMVLGTYVGAIAKQRGMETVLRSLPFVPGVSLAIVVGSFSAYVTELITLADELQVADRFHVTSYVDPDDLVQFISDADFGINPLEHAINHEISLPSKMMEYVAAGLPVLTSNVRTCKRFVERTGIGTIFEAGNVESCVEAMTELRDHHSDFRIAARQHDDELSQLTWEAQEHKLLRIYDGLIGRESPLATRTGAQS